LQDSLKVAFAVFVNGATLLALFLLFAIEVILRVLRQAQVLKTFCAQDLIASNPAHKTFLKPELASERGE
jgi:hypothetical protein